MSISRNSAFDNEISFICDECGEEEPTNESHFDAALQHIKDEGWRIKKDGSEWIHLCSPECVKKFEEA